MIDCLALDDVYDYVIVFVRKNQAAALGRERVMLGSGVAGGKKVGDIVHAVIPKRLSTPYGEIDGTVSPRLRRLVQILRSAGIKAHVSRSMSDFWTNHSFIVPPSTGIVRIIPRFLIVMVFRKLLATKFVEVGLVWHTQQAPDEMMQLAEEAKALVAKSGLPVPAIRKVLGMA